jgi:hypothetical protein
MLSALSKDVAIAQVAKEAEEQALRMFDESK